MIPVSKWFLMTWTRGRTPVLRPTMTNMAPFCTQHFQMHFLEEQFFIQISPKCVPMGLKIITCSRNGLSSNRRQDITWKNDEPVYLRQRELLSQPGLRVDGWLHEYSLHQSLIVVTVSDPGFINALSPGQNGRHFADDIFHDDVIKRKHFPRYWPFVREINRSPVKSQHKGQWRGALMFSLICAWINGWVNNREAGDLRRNRDHYDVTVMFTCIFLRQKCLILIYISSSLEYLVSMMPDAIWSQDPAELPQQHGLTAWWLHQMETFSVLLALCEGNPPVSGGFPSQRPVTRTLNKRLRKQSRRRWFETPSHSLWRHCNVTSFTNRHEFVAEIRNCARQIADAIALVMVSL